MSDLFEHLLQPIAIGSLTVPNRLMLTTHNPKLTDARYVQYLEERAAAGVGLIGISVLSETVSGLSPIPVSRIDRAFSSEADAAPDPATDAGAAFYDDFLLPRLKDRADAVHRHGAFCFGQVADRGAARLPDTFQPRVAPSAVPDDLVRAVPHVLTTAEVERMVRVAARSASRIKRAGLDGVEIHAAHGYIIEQFLSGYTNRRTDRYGGSLEKRMCFLDEIIAEIRLMCGPEFPIGLRLTAQQDIENGLTLAESQHIAAHFSDRIVYVNVTNGTLGALRRGVSLPYVAPMYLPPAFNLDAAVAIKAAARVPVVVTGRMNDPYLMDRVLADGMVDMIGATRALMADPAFLQKVAAGEGRRIRKCIGANECHYPDRGSACAVNAQLGREGELRYVRTPRPKRVLVVGAGPAGMEAARTAALRGHAVTIFERTHVLGGQIALLARDPRRAEMQGYLDFLQAELEHHGVDVRLGIEATPAAIAEFRPDALVLATGSRPDVPAVPGLSKHPIFTGLDLLGGQPIPGARVLVVGGINDHLAPPTSAELLADQGKKVLLISECLVVAQGLEPAMLHMTLKRLLDKGIEIEPLTELVSAEEPLVLRNIFSKRERLVAGIDAVVFAGTSHASDELAPAVRGIAAETYLVGDCLAPRRLVHATLDGARVGAYL